MPNLTPADISAEIAKGAFRPHTALTNMALAYYQNPGNYFAKSIFPICRVRQSADNYYIFRKEDLLRDGWQRKPDAGFVSPVVLSEMTGVYACNVDQILMTINEIRQTDLDRRQGPSVANTRQQRTKAIAHMANIHQDRIFAQKFMRSGVWGQEMAGVDSTTPGSGEFIKFSNDNSDPIQIIQEQKLAIQEQTGREPNRLVMGANVYQKLRRHPLILDRIKYSGSTANPANVTMNVLAQLFEIADLKVMMSIHNQAPMGADADMSFIGDPNAMLLAYATDTPSVDEPSAGYIFTWDMLGDGQIMPIITRKRNDASHTEEIEGLMAFDMRKTADDLAVFFKDVV